MEFLTTVSKVAELKMSTQNHLHPMREFARSAVKSYLLRYSISMSDFCKNSTIEQILACVPETACQLANYMNAHLTPSLHNEISLIIFDVMKDLHFYSSGMPLTYTLNALVTVLSAMQITILNFDQVTEMHQPVFICHLQNFRALRTLKLNYVPPESLSDFDLPTILTASLTRMANLTTFTYMEKCEDSYVAVLADNCPNLKHLNIAFSTEVSNESVPHLLKLTLLEYLDLEDSSIDVQGYAQILLGLPYLEHVGMCPKMGDVLEIIQAERKNSVLKLTKVKCIESDTTSMKSVELLRRICPMVKSLLLETVRVDLTRFGQLSKLRDFALLRDTYIGTGVDFFLRINGLNLQILYFSYVTNLDVKALVDIGHNCPNLRKLIINHCYYEMPCDSGDVNTHGDFFFNLEYLELAFYMPPPMLKLLMMKCINVRTLILANIGLAKRDVAIKKVLSENPMNYLEELYVNNMTLASYRRLKEWVASCKRIRVVLGLTEPNALSMKELYAFENRFKHICTVGTYLPPEKRGGHHVSGLSY